MKSITIRGIDDQLKNALVNIAEKEHKSINKTILSLLKQALGLEKSLKYPIYDDLDDLAGTWTDEEAQEFEKATKVFNKIDEDLWK